MHLYRVGSLVPASSYGVSASAFRDCDLYKPFGRQGRFGALYCVPTIKDMAVWLDGYDGSNTDMVYDLWEVTVDDIWVDQVFLYPLEKWSHCRQFNIDYKTAYKGYWASGMSMRDWHRLNASESFWEALVPSGIVSSVRRVAPMELLGAVGDHKGSADVIVDKYGLCV